MSSNDLKFIKFYFAKCKMSTNLLKVSYCPTYNFHFFENFSKNKINYRFSKIHSITNLNEKQTDLHNYNDQYPSKFYTIPFCTILDFSAAVLSLSVRFSLKTKYLVPLQTRKVPKLAYVFRLSRRNVHNCQVYCLVPTDDNVLRRCPYYYYCQVKMTVQQL